MEIGGVLVLCGAFGGMLLDLCHEKVANEWILLFWAIGLGFQLSRHGIGGIPVFLAGAFLPVVLLWLLFYFRALGAGDIKLLSALGGIMGPESIGKCVTAAFLMGAVFSLLFLIICGNFPERLSYFFHYTENYLNTRERVPYRKSGVRMEHFHFTVPIMLAAFLYAGGFY